MEIKRAVFPLEFKEQGDSGEFVAYVAAFGNKDSYGDIIKPGAFTESIKDQGDKVFPLLYQHDTHEVIGGFKAKEDSFGLKMDPAFFNLDTQRGREAYSNAKKGLLTGFSIGYAAKDYEMDGGSRVLTSVKLYEGSIVTFPANEKAQLLDIKSAPPESIREFESFLRDAGFSKREAKRIAAQGFCIKDRESESGREAHDDTVIQKVDDINVKLRSLINGKRQKA